MEDEVAVERASQQVIKYLLNEPEFLEHWQQKVEEKLESDSSQPSTSNPTIESLKAAVDELTSTIEFVISTFEANVDVRNVYKSDEKSAICGTNREASALFEAGLKVEKLTNLAMEEMEMDQISNLIGSACRRVSQVLKAYGKRFQGQPSLEIRQLRPASTQFCQLFYSISREILRCSKKYRHFEKSLKKLSQKVRKWSDEWNLRLITVVEETFTELEEMEKKKKAKKAIKISNSRQNLNSNRPDYGGVHLRRHWKLATSIQEVVRENEEDLKRKLAETGRRTHPAGSIATSIISKRKGFLIGDSLARARARVPRVKAKKEELEEKEGAEHSGRAEEEEEINENLMKSARKVTELVMEEMRQKMRIN